MNETLGFCNVCFRVRYLGVVNEAESAEKGSPHGTCTQCVRERGSAEAEFRGAYAAYTDAAEREDAAFKRYFEKRVRGEPTNGAALSRLSNLTSYASADLAVAAGKLYALDIDPCTIEPDYVETGGS